MAMKSSDVLACAFPEWYPKFRKVTYKSILIPLEQAFVNYLLADNLVLPEGAQSTHPTSNDSSSDDSEPEDADQVDWDEAERETPALEAPSFASLDAIIKQSIAELGGQVFTKLNWSSPKDATWISLNNSLKCYTPSDVYLLLKSSDFITHDLTQPFKDCQDAAMQDHSIQYQLVLRRWVDINPGTEFRCFVRDGRLVGVSQRDITNFYFHISSQKDEILRDIETFYMEHVLNRFPLRHYVFDIVRQCKDKVRLVDFNPYGPTTDPLLFDWQALPLLQQDEDNNPAYIESSEEPAARSVDFRFISENAGVQPNPLRHYCFPRDFVDLSTGEDPYKLMDLLRLGSQSGANDSSDSDS